MQVWPQLNVRPVAHVRWKTGKQPLGIDPLDVAAAGENRINYAAGLGHKWRASDVPDKATGTHQAECVLEQPPLPDNQGREIAWLLAPPRLGAAAQGSGTRAGCVEQDPVESTA